MSDLFGLNGLHSQPYYTGSSTTDLVPGVFPVAIGGRGYVIDPRQSERNILPRLRDAQDTEATPGEASLSTKGLWHRIQRTWEQGAGQRLFDGSDRQSDRRRFWTSRGIDIWTDSEARLLPDVAVKDPPTVLSNAKILATPTLLHLISSTQLFVADEHDTDSPSWGYVGGYTGTLRDMAHDGSRLYLATSTGIFAGDPLTFALTALGAATVDSLFFGNGRLLAGDGNLLTEIDAVGGQTTVTGGTHRTASFRWTLFCHSPEWIYAGGTVGGMVTELYRIGVDEATGGLTAPVPCLSLPNGEVLNKILYYTGTFWLATNRGLRKGVADQRGNISYSNLITAPGDVRDVCADGGYVWFTWSNFDSDYTGVGRAHAGEETADLVPVYASDLMLEGQGIVTQVVRSLGTTLFMVAGNQLCGAAEDGSLHPEGYLNTGWIDYGLPYPKILIDVDVRHAPLDGIISISALDESSRLNLYGASIVRDFTGPASPITLRADRTERFQLLVNLTRDAEDPTLGPILYRWVLRVKPAPASQDEIILAILLSSQVDAGYDGNQPWEQNNWEEYSALRRMSTTRGPQVFQHGRRAELVTVEDVRVRPNMQNEEIETDLFFDGILFVTLHTLEPT